MKETIKCRRCGKQAKDPKSIPIDGTTYVVSVCSACYAYLTESDAAYERFVVLERAKSKKKEATEDFEMTNKQGRPSSWTEEEVEALIKMRTEDVSIAEIAKKLGRSEGAVSGKLWQLRNQGKLPNRVEVDQTKSVGAGADDSPKAPAEDKAELNELEQEMAEIIEEQNATIERLTAQAAELKEEKRSLQEFNETCRQKNYELCDRVKDLEAELLDTKNALAETERQFDEYRREENVGADATLARYEKELEQAEAEISRLTRALERANRVALGVVEKFALGEAVREICGYVKNEKI